MPDAMHEALTLALMEAVGFLGLSDDEVLDLDAAVRVLENVSSRLGQLDSGDLSQLAAIWVRLASEGPEGAWKDFQLSAPRAMGLIADDS